MKKYFIVFFMCASAFMVQAQKNTESIEGNGNIVNRAVAVQSFDALEASGVYELTLTQGDKEAVTVEADENLQSYFTVHNEGSKLMIDTKGFQNKNIKSGNRLKVHVTFKKLTDLHLKTVGNVNARESLSFNNLTITNNSVGNLALNLTAQKLQLTNKSVGKVTLNGKADDAVFINSGVGSLEAGKFIVQTVDIENTGVGHAEVNAEKTLKVKDSFLGKVKNKGTATARRMNKVDI